MERPESCMDIFDLISTYGKLDEESARGIFIQVVDSVCAMYVLHGLIHRDIKDENLIVNMETGEVKIVDFGAAALAEKAMRKEFQGTRSYCPPEWFRQLQYLPLEATNMFGTSEIPVLRFKRVPSIDQILSNNFCNFTCRTHHNPPASVAEQSDSCA
ncbi:hypothetical protein KIN20_004207 [Parelaphostrongylus tenuis]|uniref:Serine/threonine-protein kinase 1 n=1 Tax=Parelaphostrongylus tenuis TaxID=148309 RepID=A0AAD5LYG1_PARTN|nr:hypothetical protein KIN20_004207 [Parelaphostrongylus tenuis]